MLLPYCTLLVTYQLMQRNLKINCKEMTNKKATACPPARALEALSHQITRKLICMSGMSWHVQVSNELEVLPLQV